MPAEFDCCECGRHVIAITEDKPPLLHLCSACTFMPGWFSVPAVRDVLDPGHDGRDRSVLDVPKGDRDVG